MHIIHIASEMAPIAKVGGLGDVILGLCRELSWKGHQVEVILPKYDCLDSSQIKDLSIIYYDLKSFYNGEWHNNHVWMGWVENIKVYFIDCQHHRYFFNRGCYYGCADDIERFIYFSRTVLEFLLKTQIQPDVLHLHDWHTALIAPLYNELYKPQGYTKPKTILTIHNIEYQGDASVKDLNDVGLDGAQFLTPNKLQDDHAPHIINILKGGIVYSDHFTTVSPNYAKEVVTPIGGRGLDGTILKFASKFSGIINGIDYSYWNPEIDRYLPVHYSSRELPADLKDHNTLEKKSYIKKIMREKFDLADEHTPIVACITRLVPQKGIELIKHTLKYCIKHGGQFVLLGNSPDPKINAEFHALKHQYNENPHVQLILHYQEELSHLLYAASDMFIVPSIFEPCGLTQLIALKYGSIPIVRKTGGLVDTIVDIDYSNKPGNGYMFEHPDNTGIESALYRAFECWFNDPRKWRMMMVHGMNIDFSWNEPSNEYIKLYEKITSIK